MGCATVDPAEDWLVSSVFVLMPLKETARPELGKWMGCATVDPAEDWLVSSVDLQSVLIWIDASSCGPFKSGTFYPPVSH